MSDAVGKPMPHLQNPPFLFREVIENHIYLVAQDAPRGFLLRSHLSTARKRPRFPSWIKSSNVRSGLRPTYFLAMETTKRRLALANSPLASSSPAWIRLARSFSMAALMSGY